MRRTCLALVAALALLPTPTLAEHGPLLVFVVATRDEPGVAARLSIERLKASLEASLSAAPSASLGLVRGAASSEVATMLQAIADGEEAWLRSSFDEADGALRDAVAWGLAHLPAVAADAAATGRVAVATARLVQLSGLAGRATIDDALIERALAWWGALPLPEDDIPPDVAATVHRLAAAVTACTGTVRWRVLEAPQPGAALVLGGRRATLTREGEERLPCGTWSLRRVDPSGAPSDWEWRVEVVAGRPIERILSPRFEAALRLLGERSLEVQAYPELQADLWALAGDRPHRVLEIGVGAGDEATVRDPRDPSTPVLGAPAVAAVNPRQPSRLRWVPWTLYGASAVALGSAVALNVVTNRWIHDQNTGSGSRFDRIQAGKTGTWTAYGLAAATALAGAAWHIATW